MKTQPSRTSLAPLILACAIAVAVTTTSAHAQIPCSYEVTTLQFPVECGIGTVITKGTSLNEKGVVVGIYRCPLSTFFQGFLWTAEEGFETLDPPQGVIEVLPSDINDHAVICGTVIVSGVGNRGFVYDKGKWTILPPVVDVPGARSSAAAINNAGTVVGQRSLTKDPTPESAYLWTADKGFTDLGVMNGPNSAARDVNEAGAITGWTGAFLGGDEAFLWSNGKLRLLGPIPGGLSSTGSAISAMGQVCGIGVIELKEPPNIGVGFVWDEGVFTLIDPIRRYDTSGSGDINDRGYVTGLSVMLDQPTDRRGYVWIDGVTHDLNDFIPDKLAVLIKRAKAISNAGQIVSDGDHQGIDSVTFLLTPVVAPLGDLDGDCVVGVGDLLLLLAEWGERDSPADLNNDGIVGAADLLILLVNWG